MPKKTIKAYMIIAACKAENCKGEVSIGIANANPNDLIERVRSFPTQRATCPVCQREEGYTPLNYTARPLKNPEE